MVARHRGERARHLQRLPHGAWPDARSQAGAYRQHGRRRSGDRVPVRHGLCGQQGGLDALHREFAAELDGSGVLAFAMDPGLVRTRMTEYQLDSEPGRRWLPRIADRFAGGFNLPPTRAAALAVDIAAGQSMACKAGYSRPPMIGTRSPPTKTGYSRGTSGCCGRGALIRVTTGVPRRSDHAATFPRVSSNSSSRPAFPSPAKVLTLCNNAATIAASVPSAPTAARETRPVSSRAHRNIRLNSAAATPAEADAGG